jgi:hypothetical protein
MNTIMRWFVLLGWYCREDYDNKSVNWSHKKMLEKTKVEWRKN